MSKFLKQHGNEGNAVILTRELDDFMEHHGFEKDTCAYGDNEMGWSTGFYDKDKNNFYRVHVTAESIKIHEEYDCGGVICSWNTHVSERHLESDKAFLHLLNLAYEPLNI